MEIRLTRQEITEALTEAWKAARQTGKATFSAFLKAYRWILDGLREMRFRAYCKRQDRVALVTAEDIAASEEAVRITLDEIARMPRVVHGVDEDGVPYSEFVGDWGQVPAPTLPAFAAALATDRNDFDHVAFDESEAEQERRDRSWTYSLRLGRESNSAVL